jgi:hypothetical protein
MSRPIEPMSPEIVDELLSAELDGDFDAAAREHGYAPAIARELLASDPAVADRRAALAAARDAVGVPPLTASDRSRLLERAGAARASDALAPRRSRRGAAPIVASVAAVAAVVALVVGVGAALTRGDESANDSSAAKAPGSVGTTADASEGTSGASSAASDAPVFDFGTAADDQALRARIEAALRSPTPGATGAPPALRDDAAQQHFDAGTTRDDCVRAQAEATGVPGPALLRGPVTFKGITADVFVFADGPNRVVLVIDDAGAACRLITSQLLRPGSF